MSKDIKRALERSSFGTKQAAAARRSVSAKAASKVVARASKQTPKIAPKRAGG